MRAAPRAGRGSVGRDRTALGLSRGCSSGDGGAGAMGELAGCFVWAGECVGGDVDGAAAPRDAGGGGLGQGRRDGPGPGERRVGRPGDGRVGQPDDGDVSHQRDDAAGTARGVTAREKALLATGHATACPRPGTLQSSAARATAAMATAIDGDGDGDGERGRDDGKYEQGEERGDGRADDDRRVGGSRRGRGRRDGRGHHSGRARERGRGDGRGGGRGCARGDGGGGGRGRRRSRRTRMRAVADVAAGEAPDEAGFIV